MFHFNERIVKQRMQDIQKDAQENKLIRQFRRIKKRQKELIEK